MIPSHADPARIAAPLPYTELPPHEVAPGPAKAAPIVLCRLPHAVLFRPAAGHAAQWTRVEAAHG